MKKPYLFAGVVLIAATVIGSYETRQTSQPPKEGASPAEGKLPITENVIATEASTSATEQAILPPMIQYIGPIKPDTSVHSETADIYRTYDDDTLEALAEGGDIMAIKVTATRLIRNPPELDAINEEEAQQEIKLLEEYEQKIKKYLNLALAYGDTELSDSTVSLYGKGWLNPRNTRAETHNLVLEKLAFVEFIAMRSPQSQKVMSASFIINSYSRYLDEPVVLTEEDNTYIRNRAQGIYDDFEAQREELGLGPFEDM